MQLKELIQSRRTIQSFNGEPVPFELIRDALELSLWAPNHKLTFPWVYYRLGPQTKERIIELAVELKNAKEPMSPIKQQAFITGLMNTPEMIALGIKRNPNPATAEEDYATMSCSVQIASMVLWEKGIGSKWSSSKFTVHSKAYEILGIPESEIRLCGFLLVGKAQMVPETKPRPPISERLAELP